MPNASDRSHGLVLLAGAALLLVGIALPSRATPQTNGGTSGGTTTTTPNNASPIAQLPVIGNANSNNTMIAVTGIDLTGSSVLYLIDSVNKQMAIYQATGGSESTQGIKLVGARRIDLDLQLLGYNDRSQYGYEALEKRFEKLPPGAPAAPLK